MKIKKYGLLMLVGLLFIFIVGCTKDSANEDEEETTEPDKSTESTDTEEPEADSAYTGGEIRIALNTQPPTLDPHMGTATATKDAARPIFETLLALNANYEVEPMLAESFEQSEDGLQFKFKLRQGVKFHNGKEMKAEDVVASLERWVGKAGRAKNAIGDGKFEIVDEYTVTLTLPEPSVGALHVLASFNQFGGIMPKEVVDNAPVEGITEYIGTGPYKFVEWKQDQYIKYERYEEYQPVEGTPSGLAGKREALVDTVFIEFVADSSTRVAGMTTEEYDIGIAMPVDSYEQLKGMEELKTEIALASGPVVVFNKKEGIMTNPDMRHAFNTAIDYESVMKAAFVSSDFYRLSPGIMFPEQKDWFTDVGKENYNPNNPEMAKEMFEKAGYNGETIRILTTRDYEYMYNVAIVVQAELKKIGVNVELDVVDWPTLLVKNQDPSAYDLFTTGYSTVTDPTQHLIFDPKNAGWNDDEKTAELISNIRTSATPADAFPYWEELQEHTWMTHLPYIRFGDNYVLYAYNESLEGFTQFEGLVLWNIGKN